MARDKKGLGKKLKSPRREAAPSKRSSEAKSRPARGRSGKSQQIRGTKLASELEDALQRQSATAEILKVIASSRSDVQPVFDVIVQTSRELCHSQASTIFILREGKFHVVAFSGVQTKLLQHMKDHPISIDQKGSALARAAREKRTIHIPSTLEDSEFVEGGPISIGGPRATLTVPLMRDGEVIGGITLRQSYPTPYTSRQIEAIETFADQAVIAIENARLFNETQEALQRQTATAAVLEVINSSQGNLNPVFDAILRKAHALCGIASGSLELYDGERFVGVAAHGHSETFADVLRAGYIATESPATVPLLAGYRVSHIHDAREVDFPVFRAAALIEGIRTVLFVPLRKGGRLLGMIAAARHEVRPFSEKEIGLLENFAVQAAIAIENARLFNETKEALEQQTATSEVLEIISSSSGELDPVFAKMLENATRVCEANFGILNLWDGTHFRTVAGHNVPPAFAALRKNKPIEPHPQSFLFRVLETHRVVHVHDSRTGSGYLAGAPNAVEMVEVAGARTVLVVPMLKDDELIGTFTIFRQEVRPFTDKQIALVENFTRQAVIAIENTRLLCELRERTDDLTESLEQQTATSEVLEIISSSPGDLDPVFQKMLENACNVCGAHFGTMNLWNGEEFINAAQHNTPPAFAAFRQQTPIRPHPDTPMAKVARTHRFAHELDLKTNPAYLAGVPNVVAIVNVAGARTILNVPMLKDDKLIGTITIFRQEVRPFTDKQIALVENFTKQAVIAIENTRLLRELRERTDDLTRSLDDLRAAQDRLVQTEKLASLGQLTAGIAHEIKNPLNFVNNFSALSAELTDELNDTLKAAALTDRMRDEVGELTKLLKDNLEKVVQHGKRADSIVKNMLLHSREGSREHRPADINSLLDESLNLAYHGARAEKGEFNIIVQRDFDADAGSIELFPQEITRAFLNLIANGVYAANRRKTEDREPNFEPTLRATTKNLGSTVEIRIRDNGTGIPAEVQEKMFNPFFTTKPAGEGTGLGLSMAHDIIVKQHGGRIDVATEPGQFTEFTIVLPRKSNLSGRDRGQT